MGRGSILALMAIGFYRKHLSAKKGYRCALGAAGAKRTCSAEGLRIFKRAGLLLGLALLRRQFDRCALAAEALASQKALIAPNASAMPWRRTSGPWARQGGFADCSGCDAPGCSGPSCDLPDLPCRAPSWDLPKMPSCGMPKWTMGNFCSGASSGAPRAGCEAAACVAEAAPCDCGGRSSGAGAARSRLAKAQQARDKRRADKDGDAVSK